ncbi:MAG: aminoacyl-tRNA hydrolase [Asgard group archaeon]|nr:aminoacyl-tRNA hydrolase [Asgard group archaeon]
MTFVEFNYKMVIAIRSDLKLTKSKIAVYASHVAVLAVEEAKRKKINWLKNWYSEGQKKVVVQVYSEQELQKLIQKAKDENLPYASISEDDLKNNTKEIIIALAIGPSPNTKVDKFTADLKLL